ncbi:alkylhydroperoxidase [Paenibacillus sp. FSL H8-0548]|uniref:carboxymuconolactone decarboxylase family protein n=1 Tax=Paenibacillus sp. FSL H8-0548 TaxID=1920422 RepID=UPI00096DED97|nr:carboxymuconolactone decarboxylase family protein [Paenibacillus sp. FSL H8-0548]OMF38317.1 alkylhydroperoxidase [Paenibacillus sp. FSL H8-0548]
MSNESLYIRHNQAYSAKLFPYAPEAFKAFGEFNKQALAAGALSVKTKELIAVAVAHITGCPYCIEAHVNKAKDQNASLEELVESIIVATAVNAHSVFYNAINALNAYQGGEAGGELYARNNLEKIEEVEKLNEAQYTSFTAFVHQALQPGLLTAKEKILIALASSHITGNAYSIEIFSRQAKEAGITLEELAELILVATALKAGAALAHRVNAQQAFDREQE